MQDRTVEGQARCRTGWRQDMMDAARLDAGQDRYRTVQMQDRTDTGQDGCRIGRLKGRPDAGLDGCRT